MIKLCALGITTDTTRNSDRFVSLGREESKLIITRDSTIADDASERDDSGIAEALHTGIPIVGIAPIPKSHLPADLVRAAEHSLTLPELDVHGLNLVIEAVCGSRPTRSLDVDVIKEITLSDLSIAVRPIRLADQCVDHLETLLSKKLRQTGQDAPKLETLSGYGSARDWGLELVADIKELKAGRLDWEDFDHKALLLTGAPGVGKTMFVTALANSAGVPLISTSVAEWNATKYLHGTLRAMRQAFDQARSKVPAILFIDEIDGISRRDKVQGDYVEYWSQIINQLLELLSSGAHRQNVIVVAATNHPDRIDPAIVRSGRLSPVIHIPMPDPASVSSILKHHLGEEVVSGDINEAAKFLNGATGADIEMIVKRARAIARRGKTRLSIDHIMTASHEVLPRPPERERRRIAVHEAGHIVVAHVLGLEIENAAIHSTGGETGVRNTGLGRATRSDLLKAMVVFMAGTAAEIAFFNEHTGQSHPERADLARATSLARMLEFAFGMGELGPVFIEQQTVDRMGLDTPAMRSIRAHTDLALRKACRLIDAHLAIVETIADELESRGYLTEADILSLLHSTPQNGDLLLSDQSCHSAATGASKSGGDNV